MRLDEDDARDVGSLDVAATRRVGRVFERVDGLVERAALDSPLEPTAVVVEFGDGIGAATWARIEARWFDTGAYNVHHVDESGRNFRFDRHPKPGVPTAHFHPPPEAESGAAEPSCISVEEPPVVARAVHRLWRRAYDTGDVERLNAAENPP
ncbi:hypothetical protein RYH80_02655 [Halobaculum sp. MBLA0147]|uniref:hypothetical protein n=1 Tax=Halobaculum sp. MBLA0147 TaxID=3079934 RepID=UPI00352480D0